MWMCRSLTPDNGHSRHAPRVLTWHNVYLVQNLMEITVMLVIFANAAPLKKYEPLKSQKIDFFSFPGQFLRSSQGHREKLITPLKSAWNLELSTIWNFPKKQTSGFSPIFSKFEGRSPAIENLIKLEVYF